MNYRRLLLGTLITIISSPLLAHNDQTYFDHQAQQIVTQHYNKYKDNEYFTGIGTAIYIPNQEIKSFYAGKESRDKNSKDISATTLFQIGSITKSFVSAIILQLEQEKKLNIDSTIKDFFPEYPKWSQVTIRSLLNMTSGVPNYSDTPTWNYQEANKLDQTWTDQQLLALVYPKAGFNPPMRDDYYYTNSSYLLAGLIVEKATQTTFQDAVIKRIIKPLNLENTFYPTPVIDAAIMARQAHGYYFNQYDNPALVGEDVTSNNLSWAGTAGAMLSTPVDIVRWVHELFEGDKILNVTQQNRLQEMVSLSTGEPIKALTENDDRGFGLGVIQAFDDKSPDGRYWFYEGETLGFRAIYMYTPCNGVIVSAVFNSATNPDNDRAGALMQKLYNYVLKQYPKLNCKGPTT